MTRIKGVALGLGVATLMVVGLACGAGETQDSAEAGPASDSPQAQGQPQPSGSPVIAGSPPAPRGSLTYEGAVYYQVGTERGKLNEADFELVGATTESYLVAPGSGESLKIYVMKGEAGNVYTLDSGRSVQIEDCPPGAVEAAQCAITMKPLEDLWTRWTSDSN